VCPDTFAVGRRRGGCEAAPRGAVEVPRAQILEVVAAITRAFQAGSFFASKKVSRDYEKWPARTVADGPPYGDSDGTGCRRAVAPCCGRRRAEHRAETHGGGTPGKKLAGARTEPHQAWRVRSPVHNGARVREIGKMDE